MFILFLGDTIFQHLAGNYSDYTVRKLEHSFTDSAQIISYIDLIYTTSPICFNATTISNLNSLILILTSFLVCKSDHIQNPTFCALVNSSFTYCFVNTIFTQKYNIPTISTLPVKLNLFNRLSNNVKSKIAFLSVTFLSRYQIILNIYITSLNFSCSLVLRYNQLI